MIYQKKKSLRTKMNNVKRGFNLDLDQFLMSSVLVKVEPCRLALKFYTDN